VPLAPSLLLHDALAGCISSSIRLSCVYLREKSASTPHHLYKEASTVVLVVYLHMKKLCPCHIIDSVQVPFFIPELLSARRLQKAIGSEYMKEEYLISESRVPTCHRNLRNLLLPLGT